MTRPVSEQEHPDALELDLLALGKLPEERAARLNEHLRGCGVCRADRATFQEERAAFDARVFPRTLPLVTRRVLGKPGFARWRGLWFALPSVAAAALAVVLWVRPGAAPSPARAPETAGDPAVRPKGGATLSVFARSSGGVFAVGPEHPALAAGTEIRFVANGGGLPFVMIASIDGGGRATIYYPFGGPASARLGGEGRQELPGSITLDDASGPERIFALYSRAPLGSAPVLEALRRLGARGAEALRAAVTLDIDVGADDQASVLFEKRPARPRP
jgi:hypothetical protein